MSATFESLIRLDGQLARKGVPPIGAWWRGVLREFYEHPTALTLVVCAGRGSAKSITLDKITLNETLFGTWEVPPGERHAASLTSRLKDEASKSIGIISHWLSLLGVRHTPTDGLIELADMPRDIRITAASVASATGWRSFADGNDEVSKWPTEGALAVDAREVLTSKAAQTATHARARHVIVSTPFLDSGPFHEMVTAGTNDRQVVAVAPTWIATDGRISEEQTRRLEPNVRVHAREYGATFGVEWEHGFFVGLIEDVTAPWTMQPAMRGRRYVVAIDPAFSRDLFAIAVAHLERDGRVIVDRVEAIVPPRSGEGLSPTACMKRVRQIREEYGHGPVLSDQHHAASLVEIAAREGVTLEPIPWTATSKGERFELVRSLMRDKRIDLPNDRGLVRELSGIGTRLKSGGHESIEARPGFTDDRVAAMVLAASTVAAGSAKNVRMANALRSFAANGGAVGAASRLGMNLRDMHDFATLAGIANRSWRGR